MAEGLTDDELQTVVDAYKKIQLERSQSEVQKDREERWELVIIYVCNWISWIWESEFIDELFVLNIWMWILIPQDVVQIGVAPTYAFVYWPVAR